MPTNTVATFITNSPDELRGSSLYLVLPNGTIRFSGSTDMERRATTFIRPYLIGYVPYLRKGIMFEDPLPGLFPFEADTNEHVKLGSLLKDELGHRGNCITEVIRFQDLHDLSFCPTTWRGPECGGTEWNVALAEVLKALVHVTQTKSFARSDIELEIKFEETRARVGMFR